jgi:hypothetical protein
LVDVAEEADQVETPEASNFVFCDDQNRRAFDLTYPMEAAAAHFG